MAQELVPRVRRVPLEAPGRMGRMQPAYIKQLTPVKAYTQILRVREAGACRQNTVQPSGACGA